jgi:hypothetical protein
MAVRTERNSSGGQDIIIDGFEKGIADDPYEGIADLRNINITSIPKEAAVQFSMAAVTLPPVLTTVAFTATASSDLITIATTTGFYNGMAIIINTIASGAGGLTATTGQNVYYVSNITSTTFKVSKNLSVSGTIDIASDGNGTLSTAQFGTPFDSTRGIDSSSINTSAGKIVQNVFVLDSIGQVWTLGNGANGTTLNALQFCGNTNRTTLTTSGSLGICVFKNYLFVFIENKIDYISLSTLFGSTGPFNAWTIGWKTTTATFAGHKAIAAIDDAMYFCNASAVGSVLQNAGSTFDPATSTTYTYNASALALPTYDFATCLAQLGVTLLVGGALNFIYPWNRVSTSFTYPLIVAEGFIKNIVSTNSSAYIFAGTRGRIYITNGANTQVFKKFPDQLASTENPFYTWGDAIYFRNQLYFSVSATDNAGTTISNFAGVWGIDLTDSTSPLRLENSLSYGTYAGTVPVIVPMGNVAPLGNGYYACWLNSTGGIDYSSSAPYSSNEAYIDTDIVPVGTFFSQYSPRQVEYKLSKPLVSGETVQIWWRGNLTSSFTQITGVTGTTGDISGEAPANFEKQQWVQLRVKLSSTASTPSFVKLREVRIR